MKSKIFLSAFGGLFFGIIAYIILQFIMPELALRLSVGCGCGFALLLLPALILEEKRLDKKYAKLEAALPTPVFYKANGNFNLGNKVRNGNIYFCEGAIIFASFDTKPFAVDTLLLEQIKKYEFDNIHMNIYTQEDRVYRIMTPQAQELLNVLRDKQWIV